MILIIILILLLTTWFVLYMRKLIKKEKEEGLANPPSASDASLPPLQYQNPPSSVTNDPLYLSTLNASNISYLKEKVDNVLNLRQQVSDISGQVVAITSTVNNLSQKLSSNVSSSTGCDPNNPSACPMNTIAANAVSSSNSTSPSAGSGFNSNSLSSSSSSSS